ncbi:MAG: 50S ribosomal protein L10 [Chlamydiales bacterium]|nr:50S ribosomal protein L10 [Chlamydiales bacterium]MCH9619178.1 50S ribosomal protein L10 [Chlamydiales bacterium]MCH9622440.1 50S ribosomal protein L10 [Chlamydiales bacterium]
MREEKQFLLDEITDKIKASKGFIVANYQEFTASRSREFRDVLAESGGEFEVVRKRVFIKAAESLGLKFELEKLKGHVGLVFAYEDTTKLAKGTVKFGEDNNDTISVLGGQVDGELCSAEDMIALAKLPSLNELRSQIVGLLQAPMAQTASVLQSALTSVLYCMEEKSKKG